MPTRGVQSGVLARGRQSLVARAGEVYLEAERDGHPIHMRDVANRFGLAMGTVSAAVRRMRVDRLAVSLADDLDAAADRTAPDDCPSPDLMRRVARHLRRRTRP